MVPAVGGALAPTGSSGGGGTLNGDVTGLAGANEVESIGGNAIGSPDLQAALGLEPGVDVEAFDVAIVRHYSRTFTIGAPGVAGCDVNLSANALAQTINLGAVFPAGALWFGYAINVVAQFSGGGATEQFLTLNSASVDSILDDGSSPNLTTIPAGTQASDKNPKNPSFDQTYAVGGQQPSATFTADVNQSTLTAGKVIIRIDYLA